MASRNLSELISAVYSLTFATRTAAVNGTGVDISNAESVTILWLLNDWTDGTHNLIVQDSPDNSVWTDAVTTAPNNNQVGTLTAVTSAATGDNQFQKVAYTGGKKFVRVRTTVSGATTGANYGCLIIKGNLGRVP